MALGSEMCSPVAANFPAIDQHGATMTGTVGRESTFRKSFLAMPAPDCMEIRRRRSNSPIWQRPTAFGPGKTPAPTPSPAFANEYSALTPTKEELKNALRNKMQSLANSKVKVTPFFRKKSKDRTSKPCGEEARRIRNRFCQARKRQQTREAIAKLEFDVQSASAENQLLKNSLKLMRDKYNHIMRQNKSPGDSDSPLNLSESLPAISSLSVNEQCAFPPIPNLDDHIPLADRISSDPSTSSQSWLIPSISITDNGQDVAHSWPGALKTKYSSDSSDNDGTNDDMEDEVHVCHLSDSKSWPSDGLSPAISMMLNTNPVDDEDVDVFEMEDIDNDESQDEN